MAYSCRLLSFPIKQRTPGAGSAAAPAQVRNPSRGVAFQPPGHSGKHGTGAPIGAPIASLLPHGNSLPQPAEIPARQACRACRVLTAGSFRLGEIL